MVAKIPNFQGKAGKQEKPEKQEKRTGKKPASRGDLIEEIKRAELSSIRKGLPGQLWFNPRTGEIWSTHFEPTDKYLPSAAADRFILLWETAPKNLGDVLGPAVAGAENEGPFYLQMLSKYVRGAFPHKFDPAVIAENIERQKIAPALEQLQGAPIKEKPTGNIEPAGGDKSTTEKLWRALVSYIAFIDDLLTAEDGAHNKRADALLNKYAAQKSLGRKLWQDIPRRRLFEVLNELKEIYNTAGPEDYE